MTDEQKKEKALELLRAFKNGMLITADKFDDVHARPMAVSHVDDDGLISFVTSLSSVKVDEVRRRSNVSLTFQSTSAFLTIRGYATVVTDTAEKARVWSKVSEVWFQGPEDPEAALIQVQPENLEYWDQRGLNSLRFAFDMVRAAVTGSEVQTSERQHASVRL